MKICHKCEETKASQYFSKESSRRDGLQTACKDCNKEYRIRNAEKTKSAVNKCRDENRDEYNRRRREHQNSSRWKKENPERHALNERRRRAAKANASGSHSLVDIFRLINLQKKHCAICRKMLSNGYHVDHVVPLFSGGTNDFYNLQLLCASCNLRKNKSDPIRHMQTLGFLL